MFFNSLKKYTLVLTLLATPFTANAASVVFDDSGAVGVDDVVVGGRTYDVRFMGRNPRDPVLTLDDVTFTDTGLAQDARRALINALNDAGAPLISDRVSIGGERGPRQFTVLSTSLGIVGFRADKATPGDPWGGGAFLDDFRFIFINEARFVEVVADPVPIPAAGWLMLAGAGALAAKRRKRAMQA